MQKIYKCVMTGLFALPFLCSTLQAQETGKKLPIDLTIRAFGGYDTNVALVTDAANSVDSKSISGGTQLNAAYQVFGDYDTVVRANLSGLALGQFSETDFNVFSLSPGLSVRQKLTVSSVPVVWNSGIGASRVLVGGDGFNWVLSANSSLGFSVSPALTIGPTAKISLNEFDDDGLTPANTSRDSMRYQPGVFASLFIPRTRGTVSANAYATFNQADGLDNDYKVYGFSVGYQQPFISFLGIMTATAKVGYSRRDHKNFTTAPKRKQKLWNASGSLTWPIAANLSADTSISWNDSNANRTDFSYDRFRASAGLTWRY